MRHLQQKLGTAWFKEVAELKASMAKENSGGLFRTFVSCTWYSAFHYGLAPLVTPLQLISRMMEAQFLSIIDTCFDVMLTFTGMESLHARPSDRIQALASGDHFSSQHFCLVLNSQS